MPFEWVSQLPRTDRPLKLRSLVAEHMRQEGQDFNSDLKEMNLSGRNGDMGLNRRSGALAGGWNTAVEDNGDGVTMRNWVAGPAAKYVTLQEFGDVVRPVRAKSLWIPTEANRTPSGVARITPTEAIERGGFFRNGVFFSSPLTRKGTKGFGPHAVALFVLKKQVTIPARMGATSLFEARMRRMATAITFIASENIL